MKIKIEERLGSVIAGAGLIWVAREASKDLLANWQFTQLPTGPLEICAIGILVWLHAKWRRSVQTN